MMDKFKSDLMDEENYSLEDIINKYIVFGTPIIFKDNEQMYYNLKRKIAEFLNINQRNIFIVGSAKLGFSIAPHKLWRELDGDSEKDSDIDVVVISNEAFDRYWKAILEFKDSQIRESGNKDMDFLEYFFRGWLRPDKFPAKYKGADEWFEFCREISYKDIYGGRKVAIAIYRDDYYFSNYQMKNLEYIKKILKNL